MNHKNEKNAENCSHQYIFNYLHFRTFIGTIGILKPILLFVLSGIFSKNSYWIQPSISHYYYSLMNFFFVGILILLGFFLVLYKGKNNDRLEDTTSTIAGIAAFFVALFPTDANGFYGNLYLQLAHYQSWYNVVHFCSAFVLFACFAFFCLFLFLKEDTSCKTKNELQKKARRNTIYTSCGIFIVFSIVAIALFAFVFEEFAKNYFPNYTFYFECIALWAFGIAWLTKGSELFSGYKLVRFIR